MRILGIDIGSTSVKAVELDTAFSRFEVHEYHDRKVEPGASPLVVAQQLIQSLQRGPEKIATAIRTNRVTFRNLQLPTKDKKAIQASVGFELDDDLPFALEDSVYDWTILSQTGQQSQVHVAATLRRNVESLLSEYGAYNLDPDLVTTEAWSCRTLMNRIIPKATHETPALLAQIGHEQTLLYIHWRGLPVLAREIAWGGRDLTAAISRKYGITLDAAEKAKIDNGFVLAPSQRAQSTPEQLEFSDTVTATLHELTREIRQAVLTSKNITHERIGAIWLSGGTSLLPGLGQMLAEELGITVQPLQALSAIASSGVTYSEHTDATFSLAVAAALCMVGPERSTAINLRKGTLAKKGRASEFNFAAIKRPLLGAGIVAACLFASLAVESRVYSRGMIEADKKLEKSIKGFFSGPVSSSALRTWLSNPASLRTAVNKELTRYREMAQVAGPNLLSPLNWLAEVSNALPKDVVVDLMHFQVGSAPTTAWLPSEPAGGRTANLTFMVANPQIAERLAVLMGQRLTEIQRSKMEEVTVPNGAKRWKITFSGKTPEAFYGK